MPKHTHTHTQDEQWRDIPGWEGLYQVSDQGRVRSLDRQKEYRDGRTYFYPGRILKLRVNQTGYLRAGLYDGDKTKDCYVHRLVMWAFVGECPKGMQVCHDDGDKKNNRLKNLRYASQSDNEYDKQKHGTDHQLNKTHCKYGHPLTLPNLHGATLRRGGRGCLACSRAHSYVYRNKSEKPGFKEIADSYYEQIVK